MTKLPVIYPTLKLSTLQLFFNVGLTMVQKTDSGFPFRINDVILTKYEGVIYYAKILSIYHNRKMAKVLFDDNSRDEVEFQNIFNVNETTSEIICVVCKQDKTEQENDIVLCDQCNVGYHQHCHNPSINSEVLLPEVPWECCYCSKQKDNPYVQINPFQNMLLDKTATPRENPLQINISTKKEGYQIHVKDEYENNQELPESPGENKSINDDLKNAQDIAQVENTSHFSDAFQEEIHADDKYTDQSSDSIQENTNSGKQLRVTKPVDIDVPGQEENTRTCNENKLESNNNLDNQNRQQNINCTTHCHHSDGYDVTEEINNISNVENTKQAIEQRSSSGTVKEKLSKVELKKKKQSKSVLSSNTGNTSFKSQKRYAKDLPRHNWLVERLKRENKLAENEIEKFELQVQIKIPVEHDNEKETQKKRKKTKEEKRMMAEKRRLSLTSPPVTTSPNTTSPSVTTSPNTTSPSVTKSPNTTSPPITTSPDITSASVMMSPSTTSPPVMTSSNTMLPLVMMSPNTTSPSSATSPNNTSAFTKTSPTPSSNESPSQHLITKQQTEDNNKPPILIRTPSIDRSQTTKSSNNTPASMYTEDPIIENNESLPNTTDESGNQDFNFTILKVESLSTPSKTETLLSPPHTVEAPATLPKLIQSSTTKTPGPLYLKENQNTNVDTTFRPPALVVSPKVNPTVTIFQPTILQNNCVTTTQNTTDLHKPHHVTPIRPQGNTADSVPWSSSSYKREGRRIQSDIEHEVLIDNQERQSPRTHNEFARRIPSLYKQPIINDRPRHDSPCQSPQERLASAHQSIIEKRERRIKAIQTHRMLLQNQQMKLTELKHKIGIQNQTRLQSVPNNPQMRRKTNEIEVDPRFQKSLEDRKRIKIQQQLNMQKQWIEEHDTQRQLHDQLKKKPSPETKIIPPTEEILDVNIKHRSKPSPLQPPPREYHGAVPVEEINNVMLPLKSPTAMRSKYEELLHLKRMERAEIARRNEMSNQRRMPPLDPSFDYKNERYPLSISYENVYQKVMDDEFYRSQNKISPEMEGRLMYQLQKKHDEGTNDIPNFEYQKNLKAMDPYHHLNRTHPEKRIMHGPPPPTPIYRDGPPPSPTYKEYHAQFGRKRQAVDFVTSPTAKLPRTNQLYNQRISSGGMVEKRSPALESSAFLYSHHPEKIAAEDMMVVRRRYSEMHPGKYMELSSPQHQHFVDGQQSLQLSSEQIRLQHHYGNERLIPPQHVHQRVRRTKSLSKCVSCNGEAQFLCSGCHMAWYCTKKCQLKHWTTHLLDCKRP